MPSSVCRFKFHSAWKGLFEGFSVCSSIESWNHSYHNGFPVWWSSWFIWWTSLWMGMLWKSLELFIFFLNGKIFRTLLAKPCLQTLVLGIKNWQRRKSDQLIDDGQGWSYYGVVSHKRLQYCEREKPCMDHGGWISA